MFIGVEATSPRLLRMTVLASKQIYCINEKIKSHPSISVEDYCGRFVDIEDLGSKESDLPNRMLKILIIIFYRMQIHVYEFGSKNSKINSFSI